MTFLGSESAFGVQEGALLLSAIGTLVLALKECFFRRSSGATSISGDADHASATRPADGETPADLGRGI